MEIPNRGFFQVPGPFSPASCYLGGQLREASIFLDESGSDGMRDRYYLLTLVIHDQDNDIHPDVVLYEQSLQVKGLPDIPFHASPLLNGHGKYEGMNIAERKKLLSSFRVFLRHAPVRYHCIKLKTSEHTSIDALAAAMRKHIVDFIFGRLAFFQEFDAVKVYYDDGQRSIADAVHKALDYALSKQSLVYRETTSEDYRISQIADYICTMELTALKYKSKTSTATDEKFFGPWSQFKKGIFKEMRGKAL